MSMEQRNEPTTAEIVNEFNRVTSDAWRACDGCDLKALLRQAIGRLERLEREVADEKKWHADAVRVASDNIAELERRLAAEKARADAAVKDFGVIEEDGLCSVCKYESTIPLMECMENCVFKWRGEKGKGAE